MKLLGSSSSYTNVFFLVGGFSSSYAFDVETTVGSLGVPVTFIPSSDCWLEAIRGIHQADDNKDSNMVADACGWMTTHHQKLLALELARCHVSDLGRHLFIDDVDSDGLSCSNQDYANHLMYCLTRLTPSAETAYTHFLTYIHQLCIRLSREVVMNTFYQTSVQLAKTALAAQEQMKLLVQQQQDLWSAWKDRHEESVLLEEAWQQNVQEDRVRWVEETSMMQREWKDQQEAWLREQEVVQEAQLYELTEQHRILQRQKEEVMLLSDTVARAQRTLHPWSIDIQSWYRTARNLSLLIGVGLHVAVSLVVLCVLTYPTCLRWLRQYLAAWVMMGGLVETVVLLRRWSGNDEGGALSVQTETSTIEDVSHSIRGISHLSGAIFFVLGSILSPCWWRRNQDAAVDARVSNQMTPTLNGLNSNTGGSVNGFSQFSQFPTVYIAENPLSRQVSYHSAGRTSRLPPPVLAFPPHQVFQSPVACSHQNYRNVASPMYGTPIVQSTSVERRANVDDPNELWVSTECAEQAHESTPRDAPILADVPPTVSNEASMIQAINLVVDNKGGIDEDSTDLAGRKRTLSEDKTIPETEDKSSHHEDHISRSNEPAPKRARPCNHERKADHLCEDRKVVLGVK